MPFNHHHNVADNQTAAGYPDQAVGPLGTGTGPSMNPAVEQPYETRAHPTHGGAGTYDQGMTHMPIGQQGPGGMNSDPYATTVANNDVAPVQHFSDGKSTGHASSTTGKIERVVGTILHSSTLKAKGIEKEQQAAAINAQNSELTEAERLEHEASLRRERAVQHGAHPSNKALGGAAQAQEFGGNFGTAAGQGLGPNSQMPGGRSGIL
ncbi:hypothetical protein BDW22DRAFT_1352527 [Trametopsis cervina]|nr:hypothetical protein BDW22DRAFT_1352527 [Trametopsis cervina]